MGRAIEANIEGNFQAILVDETGIEPATFPVGTGTLSRALCLIEERILVDETGIEPATSSLRTMRSPS